MPILATNVIEDAFSPLIKAFEAIMVFIHAHLVGGSWGLAIVGLTVLIRAILVPLTFRQLKSMQEMQRLAPQIQALKEKYKEDKQRQQQEIMKFYQAHKINPLASCLPLVLQIPVFISLFYMLRTDLKLDICGRQLREFYSSQLGRQIIHNSEIPQKTVTNIHGAHIKGLSDITCSQVPGAQHSAKFLFLPDITDKATGVALIVLIVLYVGSQIASTLVATATADPTQRRLMLLLPIVFVVILYRYPAGLLVYWITSNLWTIGQQYLIKKRMPPPATPETVKATGNGKPARRLKPALAGGGVAGPEPNGRSGGPPPRPPRKKKKRSGRRR
ncbi:MAG TPA: YidC/Oxa1 family membrane protein insertase [Solirubrobacteraceae bacterium]|jgi:YidC/Oxa1 family membrane protein insertase|nr:YidC/Oxa1 family membrane protein insertase [Solirubrobacteraceae bacterium]